MASHWWDDFQSEEEERDEDDPDPIFAGQQLVELLLFLRMSNKLEANWVCMIAWWAAKAGGRGGLEKLGKQPKTPSGHFQRHLDAFMEMDKEGERGGKLGVPLYARHCAERIVRPVAVSVPHEELNDELLADPAAFAQLREAQANNELPVCYWNHIGVKGKSAEGVFPCAIYIDGMPFRKKDSMVAFVVINLITMVRHVCGILRKSELCRCGCKGWC